MRGSALRSAGKQPSNAFIGATPDTLSDEWVAAVNKKQSERGMNPITGWGATK